VGEGRGAGRGGVERYPAGTLGERSGATKEKAERGSDRSGETEKFSR